MTVIGLVGPFGSGCSYLCRIICEEFGYKKFSLSDPLKSEFATERPTETPGRKPYQDFGDYKRQIHGKDYFASRTWSAVDVESDEKIVIDSFRNPGEIEYIKSKANVTFFLIGVFAEKTIRYARVKSSNISDLDFDELDARDSGKKEPGHGQQVTKCYEKADIIILNNDNIEGKGSEDYNKMTANPEKYLSIIEGKSSFEPTEYETYMTMAYATSLRSSCLKRKVGALIVDSMGAVFSSGCNEVPSSEHSCRKVYNECYRDKRKRDFKNIVISEGVGAIAENRIIKEFGEFKILDYCRALHAEENAIINVARIGTSRALADAVLYTTTYPCNLCANKISQVGIKRFVFFDPYPMIEAKTILRKHNVVAKPFEGATYYGYFRLMGRRHE